MNQNTRNLKQLFFVTLLITFTLVESSCSSHKGWIKAKAFIQSITSGSEAASGVSTLISNFESESPKDTSSEDLGKCSAYGGQSSCCRADTVDFIDRVVLYKVKPILEQDNVVDKFLAYLKKQIGSANCALKQGVSAPTSGDQIEALAPQLAGLNSLLQSNSACKIKFAKALSAQARGAACFACAGVDKVSSYMNSSNQIILSQSSVSSFKTAVQQSLTCFNDFMTTANIQAAAEAVTGFYFPSGSSCSTTIINSSKQGFATPLAVENVCAGHNLFSSDSACEAASNGGAAIDNLLNSAQPQQAQENSEDPMRNPSGTSLPQQPMPPMVQQIPKGSKRQLSELLRLLAQDSVEASFANEGVQSFITSPSDDSITAKGEISVRSSFSSSKKQITFFIAIMTIFLLI